MSDRRVGEVVLSEGANTVLNQAIDLQDRGPRCGLFGARDESKIGADGKGHHQTHDADDR